MRSPKEIRLLIETFALQHDGEIIPFPSEHERMVAKRSRSQNNPAPVGARISGLPRTPALTTLTNVKYASHWPAIALLGVNQQLRAESLPIFLKTNNFRLPSWDFQEYCEDIGLDNPFPLWMENCSTITIKPNMLDMDFAKDIEEVKKKHADSIDENNFLREMQNLRKDNVYNVWFKQSDALMKSEGLKKVVFDTSEVTCPTGCCRLEQIVVVLQNLTFIYKTPAEDPVKWSANDTSSESPEAMSIVIQPKVDSPFQILITNFWNAVEKKTIMTLVNSNKNGWLVAAAGD